MTSDHDTCPICNRNRALVASSTEGTQVALGKRTSCVECGLKVLERRDARRSYRWHFDGKEWSFDAKDRLGQLYRRKLRELNDINKSIEHRRQELATPEPSLLTRFVRLLPFLKRKNA